METWKRISGADMPWILSVCSVYSVLTQIEAMAERIGQSKQKLLAMEKLVAQRDEEVKNAAQAVVDANRARDRAEVDADRLRKKQDRLRSFTDEQTLAATEAAAEKTKLAEQLANREATDRKTEDDLRQAVMNAEKQNLKLEDKLAQVVPFVNRTCLPPIRLVWTFCRLTQVLSEKENLNAELRTIADEVRDVKASWMTDRALIQTLQMQLGAQQQQAGGQQNEMTAMAVQHALQAQQAQAYVAMIEQQNQQQQVRPTIYHHWLLYLRVCLLCKSELKCGRWRYGAGRAHSLPADATTARACNVSTAASDAARRRWQQSGRGRECSRRKPWWHWDLQPSYAASDALAVPGSASWYCSVGKQR